MSHIGPSPLWDPIEVDLCKLALGADQEWGLPSTYWPQEKAPQLHHGPVLTDYPGCGSTNDRVSLVHQLYKTQANLGFYVCPGSHRDRSLNYRCGYDSDFYCAAWGCETTGNTYWNPSSSWDYITVKPKAKHDARDYNSNNPKDCSPDSPTKGWCTPLVITFTNVAKSIDWSSGSAPSWGLRLYKYNHDYGLIFKIKLFKAIPNPHKVSVGPNPQLHGQSSSKPKAITRPPSGAPNSSMTPFQPTVPDGPMPPASLILSVINASASALIHREQETNSSVYENCWICYSADPPFYEGIATYGNPVYTNDVNELSWDTVELTITEVSGLGSCLLGQNMLPPRQLIDICNQTITVDSTKTYLKAPDHAYFACSTGLTTYIITAQFLQAKDYCVQIQLYPKLSIYRPETFLNFWERGTELPHRAKREPITAITLAVILGLGAADAGTGIASLVTSHQYYNQLSEAIDKDIIELRNGLANLKDSVASLSEVVLRNRRGLDLLFLQQGGLCAALREECCFYVDKTGLVEDSLNKVKESLERRKRDRERQESWYKNWFSTSPWLSTLLPSVLGPLIGLLLLVSFGPWAFQRLTRFVKSQIDSTLSKDFVSVQYHRLEPKELEESPEDPTTTPSRRLKFSKLLH
ncbi:Envelope polyprotein [Apodemus speciosus]|uniref:Envelope polyprotein n=1 Tax=Apodemus speciosus TaxID=105296 RepID=A0ABQ0ERC7_APOSI